MLRCGNGWPIRLFSFLLNVLFLAGCVTAPLLNGNSSIVWTHEKATDFWNAQQSYFRISERLEKLAGFPAQEEKYRLPFTLTFYSEEFLSALGKPSASRVVVVQIQDQDAFPGSRIRVGDQLTGIGDEQVESGKDFIKYLKKEADILKKEKQISMRLSRNGEEWEEVIPVIHRLDSSIFVLSHGNLNSFQINNDKKIEVPLSLIELSENDHEMAFLLGRYMAHRKLGHMDNLFDIIDKFEMEDAQKNDEDLYAWGGAVAAALTSIMQGGNRLDYIWMNRAKKQSLRDYYGNNPRMLITEDEWTAADKLALEFVEKLGLDPLKALEFYPRYALKINQGVPLEKIEPVVTKKYEELKMPYAN